MAQENVLVDAWGAPPGNNAKAGERGPDAQKFLEETLPNLRWQAEMDLFKYGDEQGAAIRMLDLINRNISHKNAPKWIEELTGILQGNPEGEEGVEGEEGEEPATGETQDADTEP